ncbi:MAG: hypothetical protein KQH79_09555 [Bacteroidetes bacterium]|nr:hypothetical protein [Bacteroidota bacterium]
MSSSNYIFFKAPFRTHFSLQEGNVLASGRDYHQFWNKVEQFNLGKSISKNSYELDYLHNINIDNSILFESVASDANVLNVFSPQVIQIKPGEWFTDKLKSWLNDIVHILPDDKKDVLEYDPHSCIITIFKNTVANVEVIFKLNLTNKEIDDNFIESVEKWTNQLATRMITFFYDDFILPFIKKLYKIGENHNYLSSLNNHYGFPDINNRPEKQILFKRKMNCAIPLWVSRTLLVGKIDDTFDDLVRRWIITTRSKDEVINQLKNSKFDEKNGIYLGWMHSLFTSTKNSKVFSDARQALSLTQYYYAVLDSINLNLSQIIGISHKKKSIKETQHYKRLLEEMVFIADLNKTEFTDVTQSMQRNRAFFLNDLVKKWTVNELFDNVDKKIELCKDNINKIYQKAFNRSQRVAELLLFFISGFAILEFLKGLSEFFWSPDNYNDEVWGLYNLGKIFDPNTMLWFGISVFLMLFIVYTTIINRQK